MRRAFVGFSSPVGYCYEVPAPKTANDASSSPNPVLAGGLGLVILYDEIWFACESLCPENMRKLPYVHFLDREVGKLNLATSGFDREIDEVTRQITDIHLQRAAAGIIDPSPFTALGPYISPYREFACDNHTHGLSAFDYPFGGNPTDGNLAIDLALIARFKNLGLSIVLNQHTGRIFSCGQTGPVRNHARQIVTDLTENILTLSALPEGSDPRGPYHQVVEELRNDDLIIQFRRWMDDQSTRLDNKDSVMISSEVNAAIKEFELRSYRKFVAGNPFNSRFYELFKDSVLKLVPGLGPTLKWAKGKREEQEAQEVRWQAFIATSRHRIGDMQD